MATKKKAENARRTMISIDKFVDALKAQPAYVLIFGVCVVFFVGIGLVNSGNQLKQLGWLGFALLVATLGAAAIVVWRVESPQSKSVTANDEELVQKLRSAIGDDRFHPDLIVAIARGGLIVAGYLSKQLTVTPTSPVISIWRRKDNFDFNNSYNHIPVDDYDHVIEGPLKILIVDGVCASGRTLIAARKFVASFFVGKKVIIKTAAIYYRNSATRPDYCVKQKDEIVHIAGEDE